jgi:2'-5' RNA ligase/cation transport regulator ChaB
MKLQHIEYLHNSDLPEKVRAGMQSDAMQTVFRHALNSHMQAGSSEMSAYVKAYRDLEKAGFTYVDEERKWVEKTSPTINDVHVPGPIGDDNEEDDPAGPALKRFIPPVECAQAARAALEANLSVSDLTEKLAKREALEEPQLREITEFFADSSAASKFENVRQAYGGGHAAKWATRVLGKLDKQRFEDIQKSGNGVMLSFWLSPDTAQKLAIEGGEPADQMHITLAYFGKLELTDIQKLGALETAVKAFAQEHAPLSGTLGGPGRFNATEHSDNKDVCFASFDAPGIQEFRAELVDAVENASGLAVRKDFEYTPHCTIAYIEPGSDLPVQRVEPIPVTFDRITLSIGSAQKEYPLTGKDAESIEKSVGGKVIETVEVAPDRLWVNTLDPGPTECAVFCDPHGEKIQVGDSLWWQGAICYWTPQDRSRTDVKLPKIGYSGVPRPDVKKGEHDVELSAEIIKLDSAQQIVFGWFSVVSIDGRLVEDTQGDIITESRLEKTAYDFVLNARVAGEMHEENERTGEVRGVGRLIESCVFTREKVKAMVDSLKKQGIDATIDLHAVCWWGGMKIDDPQTWRKVVTGELRAWSIGGVGKRQEAPPSA